MYTRDQLRRYGLAERRRVAGTLARLTPRQWDSPSLCAGWTVRDVAAHLVDGAEQNVTGLFAGLLAARFDIDEYNKRAAAARAKRPIRYLTEALDSDRTQPFLRLNPGALLVDAMAHHQDIRRPLGLGRDFPPEHLRACLEVLTTSKIFAADCKRAAGRRLTATDVDWRGGPDGSPVRGTAEALIMGLLGRRLEPGELSDDRAFLTPVA